jgi:hypothetical protein
LFGADLKKMPSKWPKNAIKSQKNAIISKLMPSKNIKTPSK